MVVWFFSFSFVGVQETLSNDQIRLAELFDTYEFDSIHKCHHALIRVQILILEIQEQTSRLDYQGLKL